MGDAFGSLAKEGRPMGSVVLRCPSTDGRLCALGAAHQSAGAVTVALLVVLHS